MLVVYSVYFTLFQTVPMYYLNMLYLCITTSSFSSFSNHAHQTPSRPGTEDVVVLKKELVSVQTLMDKMALELEKEKNAVQSECDKLKVQIST